ESHDIAEPETDSERAVARLWGELLGVERVGREDNFFSAGGHSLLAARLVGRLSKQLGVDVPLCSFMQEPTVSALAREVDSAERIQEPRLPPLVAKRSVRECSFAQERFWFVDQVMGASAAYNIPAALRLRGDRPQARDPANDVRRPGRKAGANRALAAAGRAPDRRCLRLGTRGARGPR